MRKDPRAAAAASAAAGVGGLASSEQAQQQGSRENRGYAVNRNEKLHLLARQKRASDNALVDRQPPAAGRSSSTVGRSTRAIRLSSVLQQAPQHFDRVKVSGVRMWDRP